MVFDFAFFLLLGTIICGAIWAADNWYFAPRRRVLAMESSSRTSPVAHVPYKEPLVVEYAKSFFPVLLIVFLLRGFLVEPFRIPSGSMIPSLHIGDFILVNKFSYGVRLPVLNAKIVDIDTPQRGDVVVFRYPPNPGIDYIKRIIGLPGDHIAYYNKVLYVNGEPVKREFIGEFTGPGEQQANEYIEYLGDIEHRLLLKPRHDALGAEYIVPEGHYFVMGDNRDNSNDSRVWGTVPEENLVGKAFLIWMNWNGGIDWERIGTRIR